MKNCLIISDTHFPYAHRDTLPFLKAIRDEYGIEIVKHAGDVTDNHFTSFHPIEYGTYSAKEEYEKSRRDVQKLAELFPQGITAILGNHTIMSYRKAKTVGIPEDHLKSYNDVYGVDWDWVDKDYFKVTKDQNCLLTHAMSGTTLTNAKTHSHCTIQGHFHGIFGIEYFADTDLIRWSMTVGCLIDPHSPAFNYAKLGTNKRPILGVGTILDDSPFLVPMILNKSGRWNKKL